MHLSALDGISIHALLAESDISSRRASCSSVEYFYPRSPCGERRAGAVAHREGEQFLSTLSLRRATRKIHNFDKNCLYFYPRSPCGERRVQYGQTEDHSYFYPRSPCGERPFLAAAASFRSVFLSTLSLRRATAGRRCRCQEPGHFYPRSPCGERLRSAWPRASKCRFLSTLSLRRATDLSMADLSRAKISIHALLAESDKNQKLAEAQPEISIHALLAESDSWRRNHRVSAQ